MKVIVNYNLAGSGIMNELKSRLTKEFQEDFKVKIMASHSWNLPVHSIEIAYQTVLRTKMDILMKMMLIAFQKATIETTEELSDILLVEPLFIQDLIDKMLGAGMIKKNGSVFELTDTGIQQVDTGIFIHEPESETKKMVYSPCHGSFLTGELNSSVDKSEGIKTYRYTDETDNWKVTLLEENVLINALKTTDVESDEGKGQVVVSEIISATDIQIDLIPCIEFRLYNEEEDLMYARVWNTLSEHWDGILETQLNEKERKEWREIYL